tara:strand:- start:1377 stop:1961 length:585 start_codon:yes stop_codon:yes gene_type:complete
MRLCDIHLNFSTDKGTKHSYIDYYDELFDDIKNEKLNVMEIGVLFGGSLKMWETYFVNSQIYGMEDFSQKTGQSYYNNAPVVSEEIIKDLENIERINLFNISCEDIQEVEQQTSGIIFNVIIDDASHDPDQQRLNMSTFLKKVAKGGIYICEDVRTDSIADGLVELAKIVQPSCKAYYKRWSKKRDDRMVVVRL